MDNVSSASATAPIDVPVAGCGGSGRKKVRRELVLSAIFNQEGGSIALAERGVEVVVRPVSAAQLFGVIKYAEDDVTTHTAIQTIGGACFSENTRHEFDLVSTLEPNDWFRNYQRSNHYGHPFPESYQLALETERGNYVQAINGETLRTVDQAYDPSLDLKFRVYRINAIALMSIDGEFLRLSEQGDGSLVASTGCLNGCAQFRPEAIDGRHLYELFFKDSFCLALISPRNEGYLSADEARGASISTDPAADPRRREFSFDLEKNYVTILNSLEPPRYVGIDGAGKLVASAAGRSRSKNRWRIIPLNTIV